METGKAIYKLLKDSTDVGDICADRIYPELAQQDAETPFIVYTVEDTTPSDTKTSTSKIDTARVELYCVGEDYEEAMDLGIAVRAALDRQGGDLSGVQVQSIQFDTSDIQFDPDQRLYVLEQTYDVRVQRTGVSGVVTTLPSNTFTVTEVDGDPSGAVNKLVFSNGTVTINGNTATVTSGAGGSLTIEEADGTPSDTATTLVFPNGTVSIVGDTATLSLASSADATTLQNNIDAEASTRATADTTLQNNIDALTLEDVDTTGILEQIASQLASINNLQSSDFPNGLIGDFNQDNVVGSGDLIVLLQYFGDTLSAQERQARLTEYTTNTIDVADNVRFVNGLNADQTGNVEIDTSDIPESVNLYYTDARVDLRINAALISDLSDTPNGIGTAGQVLVVNSDRTGYEFATRLQTSDLDGYVRTIGGELEPDEDGDITLTTEFVSEVTNLYYTDARFDTRFATKTLYHDRYATEAETERSGATDNVELYYTARADGDGLAESETSDVGVTDTINRTLYYSTKYLADPDTAGDWTEYTTQPADNATFATAKAALLAGLNETDATAETRGTLPLSLKMVRTTTAVGGDLLLDTYTGAAAAYSVRKLDKDYVGNCMRVRRDSDEATQDIGFNSNGDLDTAAIATFCSGAFGYVTRWYDQSGNGLDATQSIGSAQPMIYDRVAAAVVTENGKPAVANVLSGWQGLNIPSFTINLSDFTCTMVSKFYADSGIEGRPIMIHDDVSASFDYRYKQFSISSNKFWLGTSTVQAYQNTVNYISSTNLQLHTITPTNGYVDGTSVGTFNTAGENLNLNPSFNYLTSGDIGRDRGTHANTSEVIIWTADQSSNRTGIETNINDYFSIY